MAEGNTGGQGQIPREVAVARSRKERSEVWDHFTRFTTADGKDMAKCNNCSAELAADTKRHGTGTLWSHKRRCSGQDGTRREHPPRPRAASESSNSDSRRHGTNHLWRHVESCAGPSARSTATEQQMSPPAPSNSAELATVGFDQEKSSTELARMIALHGYPSSIVEDECFRSFVHSLNPDFEIPSHVAIKRSCRQPIEDATNKLKETLEHTSGQINLATGTAETVQGRVLYMACQFIDDEWNLHKRIMQVFMVVPFPPYHHGTLLGIEEVSIELDEGILEQLSLGRTSGTLQEAIQRWGLSCRLFSVAWCETLEKHLARKDFLEDLCPDNHPIRKQFGIPQLFCVTYTSDVLHSVADMILNKQDTYYKETCFKAVKGLHLSQEKLDGIFSDLGLNHVRTYDKRWYSYYCSLEVLHKEYSENATLLERPQLNESQLGELLGRSKFRQSEVRELLGLSKFKESEFTELLRKILGTIYRAIETISATSSLCFEELLKLRAVLQPEASDACEVVSKAVAFAKVRGFANADVADVLREAQGIVDKFLQDSYLHLSIPVVMDPRFKLEYIKSVFNDVFGSEAPTYISKVSDTIRELFDEYRRSFCNLNGEGTSCTAGTEGTARDAVTKLEDYLRDGIVPREDDGFDVLNWWKVNSLKYPIVAMMARDALAMPSSDTLTCEQISRIRSMVSWSY